MQKSKIDTVSTLTGLTIMGIGLILFNNNYLWINVLVGVAAAFLSAGMRSVLMKYQKPEETADKNTYPVLFYIKAPALLFIVQIVTAHTRTASNSFETVLSAFGAVGIYYILIHLYEYFLEDTVRKTIPERLIQKLKIRLITIFLIVSLIIYLLM